MLLVSVHHLTLLAHVFPFLVSMASEYLFPTSLTKMMTHFARCSVITNTVL